MLKSIYFALDLNEIFWSEKFRDPVDPVRPHFFLLYTVFPNLVSNSAHFQILEFFDHRPVVVQNFLVVKSFLFHINFSV